jgi:hypothetical protein
VRNYLLHGFDVSDRDRRLCEAPKPTR